MDVNINYWAVLLAAISSMVVGSIWYARGVFGDMWGKLAGVKMDRKPGATEMTWLLGSTFVASLVTAFVLAHMAFLSNKFFGNSLTQDTVTTAIWLWLGLTAARIYVHDAFEGRRKKLTILNAAHELVTLLVMAVVLGWLKP
jgi:xanthine/uracil permease